MDKHTLWMAAYQWQTLTRFAGGMTALFPGANAADEAGRYLRYHHGLDAGQWQAVEAFARENRPALEGAEIDARAGRFADVETLDDRTRFDASGIAQEFRLLFGFAAQFTVEAAEVAHLFLIKWHNLLKPVIRAEIERVLSRSRGVVERRGRRPVENDLTKQPLSARLSACKAGAPSDEQEVLALDRTRCANRCGIEFSADAPYTTMLGPTGGYLAFCSDECRDAYAQRGTSPPVYVPADPLLSGLSDDDLVTALDALDAKRETLLTERTTMNLPTVYLREGHELPPWNTLDGKLFRVANLFNRLQYEYVKREVNQGRAGRLVRVDEALQPAPDESTPV